jgi:hypothetical protein
MEEVKRCFFLHIPMATKHGTFQWPPSMEHSNGHQAWNILMATKHGTFQWPPSMGSSIDHQANNLFLLLPLATKQRSFTLSLKDGLGSWEGILFPPKKQFQFNLESVCCDKFLEGRKDQLWSWREEGE